MNDFVFTRATNFFVLLVILSIGISPTIGAQTVFKQLYLSDPSQALDRNDPVSTADATTSQTAVISFPASTPITTVGAAASSNVAQTVATHTFSYNSGTTGSNRVLMVGVSYRNKDNETISSVSYGGQNMTMVGNISDGSDGSVYIYRLVAPLTGPNNLIVTWNSALNEGAVVGAVTYAGVNQTTPTGTVATATGDNAAPTVTVTGATDRLMFGVVSGRTSSNYTVTAGGTQLWTNRPFSGETSGAGQTRAGAASVALGWTGSDDKWAAAGVSLIPVTFPTSATFTMSPVLCSSLTIKSGTITVSTYVSVSSGTMPTNPNITALLKYGSTNILSLTNPVYDSGTGLLTWTGTLGADVIVPVGAAIALDMTTAETGVAFRIDYDSQTKPSKIQLPTSTFINVNSIGIYTAAYPGGVTASALVATEPYFVRIAVSDPFGVSDINGVSLTITDNLSNTINATLGAAQVVNTSGCIKTYEYSFTPTSIASSYNFSAVAHEGFEGTVTHTGTLNGVAVVGITAFDDVLAAESGSPAEINVLTNDLGDLNTSSVTIITEPNNGSLQVGINGNITYLPNGSFSGTDQFTYQVCNNKLPTPDCDIASVTVNVTSTSIDPCGEAVQAKTFYMPFPENATQLRKALYEASNNSTAFTNVVRNIISIKTPYPNVIINYDEWEDGYETNIKSPTQSTTKIWGDGNLTNGVAPGFPTDIIPAGGGIVLDNNFIYNPRNPANIYYDGKDKIYSTNDLAISKITGDNGVFTFQNAKTDVYDISRFGKLFTLGLGEIAGVPYFSYASVFIRASVNGTVVSLDYDGDGDVDLTQTLNEGEVWFYEGDPAGASIATATDLKPGAIITATEPVGVDLLFGGNDNYGTRNINILPGAYYGNTYYTPVPTTLAGAPSVVYFVNTLATPITINWTSGTGAPSSGTVVVPAHGYNSLTLTNNSGYKFENLGGESFTAVEVMDADASGSAYDWAISLISENRLTNFASVAWAPGSLDLSRNDNPIWVTPTANTTIYIKYDGNLTSNTATMSPCGIAYDLAVPVNALNYYQVKDATDNDQSGVAIFTCDGTPIAAVYGQDAGVALVGSPSLDVGTILAPKCLSSLVNAVDNYEITQVNTPIRIDVSTNDAAFLCTVNPLSITTSGLLQPTNGTISVNSDGTITYTPNVGFLGQDAFEYRVCSNELPGICDVAKVFVNVTNCSATASENLITGKVFVEQLADDGAYTDEGFASGVKVDLYSDANCNGSIDAGDIVVKSTVSDLSGNYEFSTTNGYFAKDDFDATAAFTGNDGSVNWTSNWTEVGDNAVINTGDVQIINDPNIGNNAIRLGGPNNGISRSLTFSSASGASLKFSFRRQGLNNGGEAVLVQVNGTTLYTITDGDDVGTDNFYQDIVVTIPPANFNANGSNTIQFVTNGTPIVTEFFWIDKVELTYTKNSVCFITKVDPSNTGGAFTAASLNQQTASFTGLGTCENNNYLGVLAQLVVVDDNPTTAADIPVAINVISNDVVGSPDTLSVTTTALANQPANGVVTVNTDGTITYTPNSGFIGTDDFEYRVCSSLDPTICDIGLVTVTVSCVSIATQNTITGVVFGDVNANGTLNTGDAGISGIGVNLYRDTDGDGVLDVGEPLEASETTSTLGAYQFDITPPSTTSTYLDQFSANTTANQSHGTASWTANSWTEIVEADGFAAGDVTITSANGLRIQNTNNGARRTANLTGAISATLSFNFSEVGLDLEIGDYVDVEVASTASPSSWTLLKRYTGADGNQSGVASFDITPFMSATTTVRFISSTSATMIAGDIVYFDNVQISYNLPVAAKYIVQLAQPITTGYVLTTPTPSPTGYYAVSFSGTGAGTCSRNFGLEGADLTITKTDSPDPVVSGQNVTYTITVTNNGPSNAQNVSVSDVLPAGLTPVSATPSVGSWSAPTWTVGTLADGASANIVIVATANANLPAGTVLSNTATVSSTTTDPNATNNSSTATTNVICPTLTATAGSNGPICEMSTLNLTETGGSATSWSWSGPNGFTSTAQNPSINGASLLAAGTYTVTISIANGCSATSNTTVIINTLPSVSISLLENSCTTDDGIITPGSEVILTATAGFSSYSWDNSVGMGNPKTVNPMTTTTYTVNATDANGCLATANRTITVDNTAITSILASNPTLASCPILNNGNITVTATGSDLEYSKDNGTTWQASNTFLALTAGSYTMRVRNSISACEVTYSLNPVVLTAPTCVEVCNDGIDNDGNGLTDCDDLNACKPNAPALIKRE